jgi:hypothetical protein
MARDAGRCNCGVVLLDYAARARAATDPTVVSASRLPLRLLRPCSAIDWNFQVCHAPTVLAPRLAY